MFRIFNRYWSKPAALSVAVEAIILFSSMEIAFLIRFGWQGPIQNQPAILLRASIFCFVVLVTSYFSGAYDLGEIRGLRELWIRLTRAHAISLVVLLAVYYLFPELFLGRGIVGLSYFIAGSCIFIWRISLNWFLRKRMLFDERLLIVGADEMARNLVREVLAHSQEGYRVLGMVDDDPELMGVSVINPTVIGTTSDVCDLALERKATRVIVAQRESRGRLDLDALLRCKTKGIPVERGSEFFERLTGKIAVDRPRVVSQLVFSKGFVVSPVVSAAKRALDIFVAIGILFAALPVMVLAAIAIRLDSRGSVLFSQERVGRHGKVFRLYKFRSMSQDAEAPGEAIWAAENDPRVTRVGKLFRKTRVDELPQLWNVLVGDMSLVGPRPERPEFVKQLLGVSPLYKERLVVRPGITGWAQIQAPYASSVAASIEKLRYDLYYIKNISVFLDLSILASTVRTVLLARGAR